jgi:hypothetical protein
VHLGDVAARQRAPRGADVLEAQMARAGSCWRSRPIGRCRAVEQLGVSPLVDPSRAHRWQPCSRSMVTPGSVKGPEVSYTLIGGFSSAPKLDGVGDCAISRIGTRMSGRLPSTKIFREFGNGRVTASDTRAVLRMKSSGMALMGFPRVWAERGNRGGLLRLRQASLRRCKPDQVQGDSLSRHAAGTPSLMMRGLEAIGPSAALQESRAGSNLRAAPAGGGKGIFAPRRTRRHERFGCLKGAFWPRGMHMVSGSFRIP